MKQLNIPPLAEGETYIGAIGNKSGDVYHLVLLPGDNDRAPHAQQMEWAKSIGGDLPNKLEAAMLFANAKDQFQPAWYWTNETFVDHDEPDDTNYAWVQDFFDCLRYGTRKVNYFRSRAVRRLPI